MDFWRGQWRDLLSVKAQLQADETLKVVVIQLVVNSSIGSNIGHGRCLGKCCNRTFKVTDCKQRTRKLFRFSVSDSVGIDVQLNCSLAPWQVPLFRLACLNPWIYKQTGRWLETFSWPTPQLMAWTKYTGTQKYLVCVVTVRLEWHSSYMTRWWWTKGPSIS